jgi:hypothetical protein
LPQYIESSFPIGIRDGPTIEETVFWGRYYKLNSDASRKPLPYLKNFKVKVKGKVVPEFNQLSTTPRMRMGEWMYRSTFS